MGYKQARGVLTDPSKKSNTEPKPEPKNETSTPKRANSDIKTEDRPKGSGRSYSKQQAATKSTEGIIGGNEEFRFRSGNKTYTYVPGGQKKIPKTGYRL